VRNRVIHNATDVTHMVTDKNRPYAQVVVERKVGVSSSGGSGGGFTTKNSLNFSHGTCNFGAILVTIWQV